VLAVAEMLGREARMSNEFSILGKAVPRKDAVEKATGEAQYVADIQLSKILHARFLRSPHAHARIANIDTSKTERLPGVKCVLTFRNAPKVHVGRKFEYLLDETLHYQGGEEVAAVAALTTEIAQDALKLIDVKYEVLPAVFDAKEAMKPSAPLRQHGLPTPPDSVDMRLRITLPTLSIGNHQLR
jgi:CO/xanthine dehydrogenase Mo-binding subunit